MYTSPICILITVTGTHGIANATVTQSSAGSVAVSTEYTNNSDESGALFNLVFINDREEVDFSRSILLPLDRITSGTYTLPFDPYPGQYRVFVYDIESDGTLTSGVGYPAVTDELITTGNGQGSIISPILLWYNLLVGGSLCHDYTVEPQ